LFGLLVFSHEFIHDLRLHSTSMFSMKP